MIATRGALPYYGLPKILAGRSGQWRAMPDGIDGSHGNGGNVVPVSS